MLALQLILGVLIAFAGVGIQSGAVFAAGAVITALAWTGSEIIDAIRELQNPPSK